MYLGDLTVFSSEVSEHIKISVSLYHQNNYQYSDIIKNHSSGDRENRANTLLLHVVLMRGGGYVVR